MGLIKKVYAFYCLRKWKHVHVGWGAQIINRPQIQIGQYFYCGRGARIEAVNIEGKRRSIKIVIKDHVSFSDFIHIGAVNYVEIGNHVLFGSKCYVTDHNHGIYSGNGKQSDPDTPPEARALTVDKTVIIEDNVWLGDHVVVLPGVRIGKGSIVGSNAVVSRDIPPYSIAVGIPARVIKQWNPVCKQWEKV